MTGPEHYREAERLTSVADDWLNADYGWKAHLSTEERSAFRAVDLAAAQVHATLAVAAATALNDADGTGLTATEYGAWDDVAATSPNREAAS
jgi:hypothetical protein